MPSTQLVRTGSLEQILRCLATLAMSPAYTTELQSFIADMSPGLTLAPLRDANGATFVVDITDDQFGDPSGWVGMTRSDSTPGFADVQITTQLKLLPPYPRMLISVQPGRRGLYNEAEEKWWKYVVDAVVICAGDLDPNSVQREALVMADAFENLIYRNQQLGGLVGLIDCPDGPVPGGTGAGVGGVGTLAAAMVRFQIDVLRVAG